ncbi:MAG: Gfo/Idh/MocA family oxidoreductase [Thermoguttaceae bacterium]|jgi:predicted dehydrogenase|nr:Gfo/Idh/MocA family oxidoreductase [Thermoguttaceae bacterium]
MKLRVGLVGLGDAWEHRHRPALRALADRFEVRAVCDQVGRRAQLAAAEFGAQTVDGFRALTAREDIDAVLMLAPQWYGSLPILAACDAGKAVYFGGGQQLEPEHAETIRRRVQESGIAFMVEFLRRQSPATLRLKELIATRLGPPRLLFCHHRLPIPEHANHSSRPHRTIVQELVEQVDWCRYVVGKDPHWVTGMTHTGAESEEADYQMMSLDFSEGQSPGTGAIAQISCGRYFPAAWHEAINYRPLAALQVSCAHGVAFVDLPATVIWFDEAGRHHESLESERPVGEHLLTQFHRSVTSLVRRTTDLEDACRALWIVQQADRSFSEGRRVALY